MFILIEKERKKKTVCEAILREIIYIPSVTRPSRDNQIFSPSWVYHTFLSMKAPPLKLRSYARILGSK